MLVTRAASDTGVLRGCSEDQAGGDGWPAGPELLRHPARGVQGTHCPSAALGMTPEKGCPTGRQPRPRPTTGWPPRLDVPGPPWGTKCSDCWLRGAGLCSSACANMAGICLQGGPRSQTKLGALSPPGEGCEAWSHLLRVPRSCGQVHLPQGALPPAAKYLPVLAVLCVDLTLQRRTPRWLYLSPPAEGAVTADTHTEAGEGDGRRCTPRSLPRGEVVVPHEVLRKEEKLLPSSKP